MNIEGFITLLAWFMGVPTLVFSIHALASAAFEKRYTGHELAVYYPLAAICWAWILSR